MTNILALETSTDICSVSIRKGVDVFNFHESLPRQHTENLLSVISELLNESKLGFEDLDAIAVGVGPGSYTGVRLSCAVAQGIAFSHDIKGLLYHAKKQCPEQLHMTILLLYKIQDQLRLQ